jgi:acid phosphatase (class A)
MKSSLQKHFCFLLLSILCSFSLSAQIEMVKSTMPMGDIYINANRFDVSHYVVLGYYSGLGTDSTIDKKTFRPAGADLKKMANTKSYYLPFQPDSFNVSPPPANSSAQTKAELDFMLELQMRCDSIDKKRVQDIDRVQYNTLTLETDKPADRKGLFYIGGSIGDWYNPKDMPATADLLAKVVSEVNWYVNYYKLKYNRTRPWMLEPKILPLYVNIPNTSSYPSGHGAMAHAIAYVMMELAPKYKSVFLREGVDFAWSREQGGIHYPSDTDASRRFVRLYVDKLFKSSAKFKEDFDKAKAEWVGK